MPKIDKIQMPNGTVYDIGGGSPDEVTINLNSDNELQAIALMDSGDNTARKERYVTQAQYDAMKEAGTLDDDTYYNTPDDVSLTILETIYPIGSVYITTNNTCPLSALFGTWQLQTEFVNDKFIIQTGEQDGIDYRIWNDGYCEQWGYITTSTAWTTVNLPKSYLDTNYLKMATNSGSASSTQSVKVSGTVTNSSFQILNSANSTYCYWRTCGYLAEGQYTPIIIPQYNKFRRTA